MTIIDKKGKLFGLINIIDLLVLVIVVGLLAFGAKRMGSGSVSQSETKEALVTYEISEIRQLSVDQIKPGDPLYHYDKGTYIGTIENVDVEPYREKVDYNGRWVEAEVPKKFVATVTVKANIEETDQYYLVGGEQTRVGIQFRLKNKNFAAFGTVIDVEVGN
ncbi:MAG: DUF4330 domain-containing protein [Bacillota bacterium]|nr:DUF4330 domain-containing protein [Bacillota bacterium]